MIKDKNIKNDAYLGEGAEPKNSLFKPLVATSLALALGVSMATGAIDPTISINGGNTQQVANLTWKSADTDYVQFQYGSDNPIRENVQLWIDSNSGNQTTSFNKDTNNTNQYNLTFANGNATLDGMINGLKMGANGTGNLNVNLWSNSPTSTTMTLDLRSARSDYALWGNLNVMGSAGTNTFEGKFGGKGIKGNVSISTVANTSLLFSGSEGITGSLTIQENNSSITLKNLTSVTNGIYLKYGTRTITFQNSSGTTTSVPALTANINLQGGNTTISGLSTLRGNITTRNTDNGATINFATDTTIIGNIITSQSGGYNSTAIITATNLTFGDGTNPYTIQSNAEAWRQTKNLIKATGSITFKQTGIIASNNTAWANWGNKINILSSASMSGTIDEITSAMNGTIAQNGDASRVYNVLSFENGDTHTSLTIGNINKQATVNSKGGYTGNNYIIKGITTGSNGSLALNFNNSNWNDSAHQANVDLTITGDIFSNNGANYINVKSLTANTVTASGGSNNIVAGSGTSSGANSISGNILANGGNNSITLGEASSNSVGGNITTNNGTNTLVFSGTSNTIEGDISINATGGLGNLKNIIVAKSGGINFGKSGGNQTILAKVTGWGSGNNNFFDITGDSKLMGNTAIIARNQSAWGSSGSNNIFKINGIMTSENGAKITEISSVGTWQDFANGITASNILSFDQSSNTNLSIEAINKKSTISGNQTGNNYIGKEITKGDRNTLALMDGFASSWNNASHQANINLTISEGMFANRGANYINVNQITLSGGITASGGSNNIVAGSGASGANSISGGISAGNGTNSIAFNNTLNNNETNSINGNISVNGDGRNTISSTGSLNIGTSSAITLTAQWGQNNITSSGSITLGSDSNKVALNAYGNAATNVAQNSIVATGGITGHFSTLSVYDSNSNGNGQHKNIITGGNNSDITIDSMSATRHSNNSNSITVGGSSQINVAGNISSSNGAKNNFTFTGDNSTLTLKGANSVISTLTASASASSGDTLTLDTSSNESVVAKVDSLVNGGNLKVSFGGNTSKSTQLTLNTANATALKSVSVTNGTSNTLVLSGTGTTAISEKVAIGANQGITFDLAGGASLTFSQNLETQASGTTTFNLGGTNTLTGTLSNSGTHSFVVKNNATLKYDNGLSFSTGTNNITFDTDNKTLSWQDTNGGSHDISTSGSATTNISFNSNNGVLNTGVNTTAGTSTITIANNKSGTIKGNISDHNAIVFNGGTAKLTLQGSDNTLSSVTANNAGILSLDGAGSQGGVKATIQTLADSNLTANFNGVQDKKAELVLSNGGGTLAGVTLGENSTNNTLTLSSGTTTITGAINVGANQGIAFDLANGVELSFSGGMNGSGASVVNVASNGNANSATLSGAGAITLNTLNLSGNDSSTLTLKSQNIDIATINANATTSNTLKLDSSANAVNATLHTIAGNLDIDFNSNTTYNSTLNLNGGVIQKINVTNGNADKNLAIFSSGNNIINNAIDNTSVASSNGLTLQVNAGATLHAQGGIDNNSAGTINVALNGGTLTFGKTSNKISSLSGNGGKVDLANNISINTQAISPRANTTARNTLTIDNYTADSLTFNLYADTTQSDLVVFTNGNSGKAIITLSEDSDIHNITYSSNHGANNTLVAKIENGSSSNMVVEGGESFIGIEVIQIKLQEVNNNGNKEFYIGEVIDLGVDPVFQQIASTALAVNYDLYLANFNSLNKRMGELRDDANSNGVWARVFGGAMSNDFGAGSKTEYITAQAGYDYSLSVGNNARNHIGMAVAYGTSDTKSNSLQYSASNSISLDKVNSNMVEVGIYNTFISDSGWYNDTIFKFDYIMSEFSLSTDPSTMSKTNNFAMVLSDEFGYRYKFGENEKGNWYIDPQAEFAFGYFNQSDFNRAVLNGNNNFSNLQASQDAILTLRSRIGATLGKKFVTEKGFASLYFGASYEYDYIEGGVSNAKGGGSSVITQLDGPESNGRAVLNVGSNIELTKGARLYIDVEKSFGDKQRTFMQFNLGARYSF